VQVNVAGGVELGIFRPGGRARREKRSARRLAKLRDLGRALGQKGGKFAPVDLTARAESNHRAHVHGRGLSFHAKESDIES
jgi:hypothetical protein